jgi:cyclopropane fatty-acyl-phospholipid synthase-like methyltransferase
MKTFNFDHEPTFAELWDVCVYNLLYKVEEHKKDIESLFQKLGVSKESKIMDVSSGGGFPAIELIKDGYTIDCADGFDDEVELFNQKAKAQGINVKSIKAFWKDLPNLFQAESFDFLFCRGNSFIYAGGGWNSMIDIDQQESAKNYKDTLKIFYDLLKHGGWMYIDKFKDEETTHRETVCEIKVNDGNPEDLIFWTERFPEQKIRQASMIRKDGDYEKKTPNITYDLSSQELESFLAEVGFKNIQKTSIPSEQHFDVWIAQK